MPKVQYKNFSRKFSAKKREMVTKVNVILAEYAAKGYVMTQRQLYYQFVARDLFPESWADKKTGSTNNLRSYQKLVRIVNDARLAGMIDWQALEDITRSIGRNSHWDDPADAIKSIAAQYRIDLWRDQSHRVEIWMEKDAVKSIVVPVARQLDVTYFSCRGFGSLSAIWEAGMRLKQMVRDGITPVILHLGDHDPSGIDMSRDIQERLEVFMRGTYATLKFERIALNTDQIGEYNPPPNPAKSSDPRFKGYKKLFGDESWELDALAPDVIGDLIRAKVEPYIDRKTRGEMEALWKTEKRLLTTTGERWAEVEAFLSDTEDDEPETDDG
jgi:hypothetical protein